MCVLKLLVLLVGCTCVCVVGENSVPKKNLLFIMFDDLRPELSVYGKKHMHTPNFDRLAKRSIVFDAAYAQISVCCPSRYSMLTGQRPDTTSTYNFESDNSDRLINIPMMFSHNGYVTAGYGKVLHRENNENKMYWNLEQFNNNWYKMQNLEDKLYMNASVTPDRNWREEDFPDYSFTSRAIQTIRTIVDENKGLEEPKPFMVGLGFKLPHLALHVPFKYFNMYRGQVTSPRFDHDMEKWPYHFNSDVDLTYPVGSPEMGYSQSNSRYYIYMKGEGACKSMENTTLKKNSRLPFPKRAHLELAWGYAAAVSFLDAQVGRLLDLLDEINLWEQTTVILTSDHGMHLGEKGFWNKWSLFDESIRVPLMIADPTTSPTLRGQHYHHPVELLDIFPTILDLFPNLDRCPAELRRTLFRQPKCPLPQGKSLVKIIDGNYHQSSTEEKGISYGLKYLTSKIGAQLFPSFFENKPRLPKLSMTFAVSQVLKCASRAEINLYKDMTTNLNPSDRRPNLLRSPWNHCSTSRNAVTESNIADEISLMGYSFRLTDSQYIIWLYYDRLTCRLNISNVGDVVPYAEEYYVSRRNHEGQLQNINVFGKVDVDLTLRFRKVATSFLRRKKFFRKSCYSAFF